MSWTDNDIPDQTGRVAVITGANGGLGLASAKALARAGAHVVMAARNQDKAARARDEILAITPEASLEVVELDLGSFESTRKAAAQILAAHPKVDILMNNAGLMAMPEQRTDDGYEMQFGVNHLGHWLLTAELLPALLAADAARVVTVSSMARLNGKAVDPDNVNMEGNYSAWPAYGRAKLANYHFALGLQQEFEKAGVAAQSLVAHPGGTNTDLQSRSVAEGGGGRMADMSEQMMVRMGMSPGRGALSQLRAATDPNAKGGQLYGPLFVTNGVPVRRPILRPRNTEAITTLWLVSERATGAKIDVGAAAP